MTNDVRLRFSLLGLLFLTAFIAVAITSGVTWTAVPYHDNGTPVPLIYLVSSQMTLVICSVFIMGICAFELIRQKTSPPRPRFAIAGWMLLAACFLTAAAINWHYSDVIVARWQTEIPTLTRPLEELVARVIALLVLCASYCVYHASKAYRRMSDSINVVH